MKSIIKLTVSTLILFSLLFALDHKWGGLPRIAPFFSPFEGFWVQASGSTQPTGTLQFGLPGLKDGVQVTYDSLAVPHIFAQNDHDLYFMQGFVTAKDRLWQMELQAYAGAGRLTELLGETMLDYDRYQRRIGMVYGAEKFLAIIEKDSVILNALNSYTEGVNAWIEQLGEAQYPLEYKLLDIAPEPWTNLKSCLFIMTMTYDLAGRSRDLEMTNARVAFGQEWVDKYLVTRSSFMHPIIPSQKNWEQWELKQTPRPDSADSVPAVVQDLMHKQPDENNGSNNWALSGDKTVSGYPMLASDPHLNMTAPSIWYQIQLHSPNVNAVGVSFPGAPFVIFGFNEKIAWGETNVDADVLDYYALETRKAASDKVEYFYEGEWVEATSRLENYKVRNAEVITERLYYSHHGPIVPNNNAITLQPSEVGNTAMKWIGHEPDNIFRLFYQLNRAANYTEFKEALSYMSGPAQNFVFASNDGDIAMYVSGTFPNKWEGQGRYIMDGSKAENDWPPRIPFEYNPHMKNPERGFVSSANQRSAAVDYPFWLQDQQAPFSRGKRINESLATLDKATVEDFRKLQMDDFNYRAALMLPEMLKRTKSPVEPALLDSLANWDYTHKSHKIVPTLWQVWSNNFHQALTADERREYGNYRPSLEVVLDLMLANETAPWFDDISTEEIVETLQMQLDTSWEKTIQDLIKRYGEDALSWKWAKYNEVNIKHNAQISGLGFEGIVTNGSSLSPNAIRAPSHGPSWRMIVEMGPEVKGYGVYPGGQSGNPGSSNYDRFLQKWIDGELFPIHFYRNTDEANAQGQYSVMMRANRKDQLAQPTIK
jgi:penicillin amidase